MSKLSDIEAAVAAATGGKWSWHNRIREKEGGAVLGYDRLETEYEEGGGDDIISWRKSAWIAVSEPDALLIENAKDWLTDLVAVVKAAQAVVECYPVLGGYGSGGDELQALENALAKLEGE